MNTHQISVTPTASFPYENFANLHLQSLGLKPLSCEPNKDMHCEVLFKKRADFAAGWLADRPTVL